MRIASLIMAAALAGLLVWLQGGADELAPRPQRRPASAAPVEPVLSSEAPAALAEARRVELLALRRGPGGQAYALLRLNGGATRAHGPGDSLGPGVRLARIEGRAVEIERGNLRERLVLPDGAAPLPTARVEPTRLDEPIGPIARPADQALPSSTGLERAIRRAAGNT